MYCECMKFFLTPGFLVSENEREEKATDRKTTNPDDTFFRSLTFVKILYQTCFRGNLDVLIPLHPCTLNLK